MGTERDRLGSELARVDILKRDLDLGSRVGRRQELEQGFEAGDEVVVDRHDDLADLQQPVDRTLLDHTVEPDPALDDGLDAEIFERGDNRRLFRHRHQLEIALALLCRGAGTEDLFSGAQFDGVVGVRTNPVGDGDLIIDRHRREQDLALGLENLDVGRLDTVFSGPRRSRLQGHSTVVDDRVPGKDPTHPLSRHGVEARHASEQHGDQHEHDDAEPIAVPGVGDSRHRGSRGWR